MRWNFPERRSRSGVVAHDVARDVLNPRLVVAGLVADEDHDHSVHDDRGRRGGDHAQLPRNPMVRVVGPVPVQPGLPVPHEVGYQIDDPGLGEILQRYPRAPVVQGSPRPGVQSPEEVRGRRDVDHAPSVNLRVGQALSEVGPRRAQVSHRLRLPERPERFASGAVRSRPPGAADRPPYTARRLRRPVLTGPCTRRPTRSCPPRQIQATCRSEKLEALIWLSAGAGPGVPGVPTQVTPFPVLEARRLCGAVRADVQHGRESQDSTTEPGSRHHLFPLEVGVVPPIRVSIPRQSRGL